MLACGSSTDGAGNVDLENVGVSEGALTAATCPNGYGFQTTTLPFGSLTSRCNGNSWDYDKSTSVPSNARYYFTGFAGSDYFGAECGGPPDNHHYIEGISARTDVVRPHAAKCSTRSHGVLVPPANGAAVRYLSRTNRTVTGINPPRSALNNDPTTSQLGGWDWDPGNIKAECGFHQVVTGVGQTESGEIDAISCSQGNVSTGASSGSCKVVKFIAGDNCLDGNCSGSGNWDPTYNKTMCRSSQYIKGVSKRYQAVNGLGEISAILCCNW